MIDNAVIAHTDLSLVHSFFQCIFSFFTITEAIPHEDFVTPQFSKTLFVTPRFSKKDFVTPQFSKTHQFIKLCSEYQ